MVHSQGKQVARHERSYLVKQEVLSLEHYLNVLEHKPGAMAHSKALVQYRNQDCGRRASMCSGKS